MSEAPKVKTSYIYPPIPFRHHDWCAWYDDLGEEGPVGFGPTERSAIHDLLTNYPLEDDGPALTISPDDELLKEKK